MKGFAGFPKGNLRFTPVPSLFFSELLPIIDDIDELKVTLYCFWLVGQRDERAAPAVQLDELQADQWLLQALGSGEQSGPWPAALCCSQLCSGMGLLNGGTS
jgi:DNA replication protein